VARVGNLKEERRKDLRIVEKWRREKGTEQCLCRAVLHGEKSQRRRNSNVETSGYKRDEKKKLPLPGTYTKLRPPKIQKRVGLKKRGKKGQAIDFR